MKKSKFLILTKFNVCRCGLLQDHDGDLISYRITNYDVTNPFYPIAFLSSLYSSFLIFLKHPNLLNR